MKSFLGNLVKSKGIVTIIAVALCTVIIFFAYRYRVNQITNPVNIPVAKIDIMARTEITDDMIKTIKIPKSMVKETVIRNKVDILNKYVNFNTYIPAGSMFYEGSVVNWSDMPDSAWNNIPEGNTIVSLPVSSQTTFGNSIYPKDKIDLYYKSIDSEGKLILGKLIEGIEVLAVKDTNGNHIFKRVPDQGDAAALIFSVKEEYHLLLRKAMYLEGEIIPVPRNEQYDEPVISSEYLKMFILNQTIEVIPDEVEAPADTNETADETKSETKTN